MQNRAGWTMAVIGGLMTAGCATPPDGAADSASSGAAPTGCSALTGADAEPSSISLSAVPYSLSVLSTGVPVQILTAALVNGETKIEVTLSASPPEGIWYLVEYLDDKSQVLEVDIAKHAGGVTTFRLPRVDVPDTAKIMVRLMRIRHGSIAVGPRTLVQSLAADNDVNLASATLDEGGVITVEFDGKPGNCGVVVSLFREVEPGYPEVIWTTVEPVENGKKKTTVVLPALGEWHSLHVRTYLYRGKDSRTHGPVKWISRPVTPP